MTLSRDQFPFDRVCSQVRRLAENRGFSVEGLDFDFKVFEGVNGFGSQRTLVNIWGDDFKIRYRGGELVSEIIIPGKELHIYSDESGPVLYLYVGENWEYDKLVWMRSTKLHERMRNEPQTYLRYEPRSRMENQRAESLWVIEDLLGREYKWKQGDPVTFVVEDLYNEFRDWLIEFVLEPIREGRHPGGLHPLDEAFV